ncbi:MAG TPA: WhiB family transcriptional regulator [Candidatus Saccharimonadales bacterium]|nr:WhiB family transcriptional regulator [Candidatus Saccharimonadales bacterium]
MEALPRMPEPDWESTDEREPTPEELAAEEALFRDLVRQGKYRPTWRSTELQPKPASVTDEKLPDLAAVPWQDKRRWAWAAACRKVDPDMFYGSHSIYAKRPTEIERQAKKVCADCPVQAQCLTWALNARERWGVWGGMTVAEREALTKRASA